MDFSRTDDILIEVIQQQGTIDSFLDAVFGFLLRHTDFYNFQTEPNGFDKDVRESIVLAALARHDPRTMMENLSIFSNECDDSYIPPVVDEVEIATEEIREENEVAAPALEELKMADEEQVTNWALTTKVEESVEKVERNQITKVHEFTAADYKNGACFPNYCWAQTKTDLELHIKLPTHLSTSKLILIDIKTDSILVRSRSDPNNIIISGQLSNRVKHNDVLWTINEEILTINLDKSSHVWWEKLFCTETPIDVKKIDIDCHIDELPEDSQAVIHKVYHIEQDKQNNQIDKTFNKEEAIERLRMAWDAEGSPFKGSPFDPSVLDFGDELKKKS